MKRLAIAFLMALAATAAQAAGFKSGPNGDVPECGNAKVLMAIGKRFDHASKHLHKNGIAISAITKVHEHRFHERTERSPIARRYCGATAHMNDGRRRTLWYLIEDGMGFAGYGDNVEFCVSGLDPLRAYGGHCRVLR
jgi:hypothetical protein